MSNLQVLINQVNNMTDQDIERFKESYSNLDNDDYESNWIFIEPSI